MMRLLAALSLLVGAAALSASAAGSIVHVDLTGSDSQQADGSAEHPFRTLAGWAAVRGAAASRASGIHFGPGIHDLVSAGGLKLDTPGTEGAPFTVTGAGAGLTQLSAAVQVQGFTERTAQDEAGRSARQWRATMPANTTYFRQLFVRSGGAANFSRRLTARSPTMSYDHANTKNPQFAIVYNEGQVKSSYHNQEDVLATLYHCWTATSKSGTPCHMLTSC
jgi:hypothetical protein